MSHYSGKTKFIHNTVYHYDENVNKVGILNMFQ